MYANINGTTSGSAVQSYGFGGVNNALTYPDTYSNFGFGLTVGNPFNDGNTSQTSIQMINECGSIFDFRTTPPSFDLRLVGTQSEFLLGCSGSSTSGDAGSGNIGADGGCGCVGGCGNSYIKWNGCKVVISGAVDENGNPFGSGTGGGGGVPGSSGTSGITGTSGTSGSSGAIVTGKQIGRAHV